MQAVPVEAPLPAVEPPPVDEVAVVPPEPTPPAAESPLTVGSCRQADATNSARLESVTLG